MIISINIKELPFIAARGVSRSAEPVPINLYTYISIPDMYFAAESISIKTWYGLLLNSQSDKKTIIVLCDMIKIVKNNPLPVYNFITSNTFSSYET
jgi:hypothetical protein